MATQEQLEAALRNAAVKARQGDERAAMAARRFASELKAMRAGGPAPPTAPRAADDPSLWEGGRVPSVDPTEGLSGGQLFGAAYGGAIPSLLRGGRQLLTDAASFITPYYGREAMANEQGRLRQEAGETASLEAPLMGTTPGVLGSIAGNIAPMFAAPNAALPALGRLAPYANAAVQGGAFGALQPVADGESRGVNTAVGAGLGVVGQGIAGTAQKAATRAVESLSPVVRQSINSARAAGIPLNVAQVTNSAPIRAAQAVTKYLPFSGAGKSAKAQQEAFNRAVARSFGEDAPTLSDDVMKAARQRLGDQFDDIYGRNEVAITPDVARRMAQVESNAARDLTGDEAGRVSRQFQRILDDAADGVMTGDKYKSLRGSIKKLEDNTQTGQYVRELRQLLDDAAVQSVGPDDAARLAKIRGQYANLRVAEDALKQVSGAAGDIRPASLYPLIRKGSTKEMRELAKIGQNVLKETIGDSGTGPRNLWAGLLTGGGAAGGMAGGLAGAGAAVSGLAKLAAAGAIGGRVLNSQAASKLLQQGRPTQGLARLVRPAPKLLPAATPALAPVFDIGTVSGYDPNDPRYRGD